jgi:hypothetical protein
MTDHRDWRLTNQQCYLQGVSLSFQQYRPGPGNDHDHCEFCWAKFMVEGNGDTLHAGFATADQYRWICEPCFTDFRDMFRWSVDGGATDPPTTHV